mgnify:CR=1 FL=1
MDKKRAGVIKLLILAVVLVYCLIDIYHNNMVFYAVFWYTKRNGGEFIWQERKSIMLSSPIRNIKS